MKDLLEEYEVVKQGIDRYKVPLGLGMGSILCIAIAIILLIRSLQPETSIEFSTSEATQSGGQTRRTIKVDVAGAVKTPGLYEVGNDARVEDLITVAGGLSEEADIDRIERTINRAQKVVDGSKFYFPSKQDSSTSYNGQDTSDTSHILGSEQVSSVSLNSSSQDDLEGLPDVGPVTATKIISGRPYTRLEELVEKKIIGQKTYDKIKDQLTL